jgi:MFS family permease
VRRVFIALAAGLALADASIVTLGLPSIRTELGASINEVAAVLGVYTLVLAIALLGAAPLARIWGGARVATAGGAVFGLASLACGLVDSVPPLLVLRGVEAVGAAGVLVGGFTLLDGGHPGPGRRLWFAASIFGAAVGPALGGALTEAFDWRAIFLVQVPLIAPAVVIAAQTALAEAPVHSGNGAFPPARPRGDEPASRLSLRPALALALLSAALTAVIFLVVLLLVAGWSIDPLAAAAAVSVLPVAAAISSRVRGNAETRAAAGCVLVAGGIACLALLPGDSAWLTVPPQILAGAGIGLALPALAGELLPERSGTDVARVLAIRHLGIVLALVVLAPVVTSQLNDTVFTAQEEGTAAVLDAKLPPEEKIKLAPELFGDVNTDDPRGQLQSSVEDARVSLDDADERAELDSLAEKLDDVVTGAVRDAFRTAFIITAGFGLAAALMMLWGALAPGAWVARRAVAGAAVAALAFGAIYAVAYSGSERERIAIKDPCTADRELPDTGGITGALQDFALSRLDDAACELGSSREELFLALFDDNAQKRFEDKYGKDPRSLLTLGPAILGF